MMYCLITENHRRVVRGTVKFLKESGVNSKKEHLRFIRASLKADPYLAKEIMCYAKWYIKHYHKDVK